MLTYNNYKTMSQVTFFVLTLKFQNFVTCMLIILKHIYEFFAKTDT